MRDFQFGAGIAQFRVGDYHISLANHAESTPRR